MQPVDGLRPGAAELVTAVSQHDQHHQLRIHSHLDEVRGAQRDHRHRVRIDRVGLAAVAGGEYPHLRGQLGRHVVDRFAIVHQPVRQVLADAVATLDGPHPIRVPAAGGEHLRVAVLVGAEPADIQYPAAFVDDLDRGRALKRIHPDDHTHRASLNVDVLRLRKGTATSSRTDPFPATPCSAPDEAAGHE